jgi:hypothetical protein
MRKLYILHASPAVQTDTKYWYCPSRRLAYKKIISSRLAARFASSYPKKVP